MGSLFPKSRPLTTVRLIGHHQPIPSCSRHQARCRRRSLNSTGSGAVQRRTNSKCKCASRLGRLHWTYLVRRFHHLSSLHRPVQVQDWPLSSPWIMCVGSGRVASSVLPDTSRFEIRPIGIGYGPSISIRQGYRRGERKRHQRGPRHLDTADERKLRLSFATLVKPRCRALPLSALQELSFCLLLGTTSGL